MSDQPDALERLAAELGRIEAEGREVLDLLREELIAWAPANMPGAHDTRVALFKAYRLIERMVGVRPNVKVVDDNPDDLL